MRRLATLLPALAGVAMGAAAAALVAAPRLAGAEGEPVVQVTAKQFEFIPETIRLKRGVPVILELSSLDRPHGFRVPALGIKAEIPPDDPVRVRVVPEKAGTYSFACDHFCGSGHEDMEGTIVVEE